jgi:hypothetical protein
MQLPPPPSPRGAPSYDEIVTPASFGLGAEVLRRAGPAFERLKRMATARDDPAVSTARRIYIEFYSDR